MGTSTLQLFQLDISISAPFRHDFIILYFNSNLELKEATSIKYGLFFYHHATKSLAHSNLTRAVSSLCPAPDPHHRSRLRSQVHWSAGSTPRQSTETCWSLSSSPSTSQSMPRPLTTCAHDARCDLDVELDFVHSSLYNTAHNHLVTIHHCLVRSYVSAAHPSLWLVITSG